MPKKESKRIRKPVLIRKGGSRIISSEDQAKAKAKSSDKSTKVKDD